MRRQTRFRLRSEEANSSGVVGYSGLWPTAGCWLQQTPREARHAARSQSCGRGEPPEPRTAYAKQGPNSRTSIVAH